MYKEHKQKIFMFFTFIISYVIFYFLILINFIKIYSFAHYIPFIIVLLGLLSFVIFIDTTYYNKIFYNNNTKNKNIKIDVSIPLIFVILALSIIILSINLLNIEYGLYNLLKILSNSNILYYTIFSLIYLVIFIFMFCIIILLLTLINSKIFKNKYNNLINNSIFILIGIIFLFFS